MQIRSILGKQNVFQQSTLMKTLKIIYPQLLKEALSQQVNYKSTNTTRLFHIRRNWIHLLQRIPVLEQLNPCTSIIKSIIKSLWRQNYHLLMSPFKFQTIIYAKILKILSLATIFTVAPCNNSTHRDFQSYRIGF